MRRSNLDLLRAIAIVSVMLFHCLLSFNKITGAWADVFQFGWVGVDLFFVLSGFLIGTQAFTMASQKSLDTAFLKTFWIKRWTRTLPLYLVVLMFYLVVKPIIFNAPFYGNATPYFFFIQNWFEMREFIQSWSLCIEEQFYLLFPLVLLFASKLSRARPPHWVWLLPALLSALLRITFIDADSSNPSQYIMGLRFFSLYQLDGISWGVFLAATQKTWMAWSRKIKSVILFLGIFGFIINCSVSHSIPVGIEAVSFYSINAIAFAAILVGSFALPDLIAPLKTGILQLALLSFGAYLWNSSINRVLEKYASEANVLLLVSASFLGTFGLAWITYHLIEKPFLKLRSKWITH